MKQKRNENEQLDREYGEVKREKDHLKQRHAELSREQDDLKREHNQLMRENETLQNGNKTLATTRAQTKAEIEKSIKEGKRIFINTVDRDGLLQKAINDLEARCDVYREELNKYEAIYGPNNRARTELNKLRRSLSEVERKIDEVYEKYLNTRLVDSKLLQDARDSLESGLKAAETVGKMFESK